MEFYGNNTPVLITIIIILLIGGMGILNYSGIQVPYVSFLQQGIFNIISPVIEYFSYSYKRISTYWNGLMKVDEIIEENQRLHHKIDSLENKIRILSASNRQNKRLEKLNDFLEAFKNFSSFKVKGASVIGYGPSNWEEKLIINQGTKNGIKSGMPVISYNGVLVGRVDKVGANTAQVILINNPDFAVGGIVQDSRVIGLIKGQIDNRNINIMEKLPADSDIEKGDRILTSGLSGNFPKYLPIGQVTKVQSDNFGISRKANVKLFFRDYTVEEVLVITDF